MYVLILLIVCYFLCTHGFSFCCSPLFSVTFKSSDNQRVVKQLVTEVKGLNDNVLTQHIKGALCTCYTHTLLCPLCFSVDAAYSFYRSHRESLRQSLKRRGKSDMKQRRNAATNASLE